MEKKYILFSRSSYTRCGRHHGHDLLRCFPPDHQRVHELAGGGHKREGDDYLLLERGRGHLLALPGSDAWAFGQQNCLSTDIISPKK